MLLCGGEGMSIKFDIYDGILRNTVKKYCDGSYVLWERQGKSGQRQYVITDATILYQYRFH